MHSGMGNGGVYTLLGGQRFNGYQPQYDDKRPSDDSTSPANVRLGYQRELDNGNNCWVNRPRLVPRQKCAELDSHLNDNHLDDLVKLQQPVNGEDMLAQDYPTYRESDSLTEANGRRFHVVIVGINKYDDPRTAPLKGCVHDALLFRDYIVQDLSVPSDRIKLLLSPTHAEEVTLPYQTPTRKNIINALYDLYDNPNIKNDDSIVLFYAGHGQSYSTRKCTPHFTDSIEAISPVDRNTFKSNSDGSDEMIVDISDREINVILGEIAKKSCENITLILDCCHAGSGTRGTSRAFDSLRLGDKECFTARYCPPIPMGNTIQRMFEAADNAGHLSPDRPRTASPNFRANMKSHVLIAAAKDYEEALEYTDRTTGVTQGYFTTRLLSALRSSTSTSTYRDVIGSPKLVMPFQTAYVAGRKTARLWFT